MITDGTAIFVLLAGILALLFKISSFGPLQRFFSILPPVIWAYFLPMFATTAGILPAQHAVYSWITQWMLPIALLLLMVTTDVRAILRLGRLALIMMLAGTVGIVLGAGISYMAFATLLPPDAWKSMATLSGSWIGGTANMVAIQKSVGASDASLGPIIVVDTVVGYGWMGILLILSSFHERFDRWSRASKEVRDAIAGSARWSPVGQRAPSLQALAIILGLAFVGAGIGIWIGARLPAVGDPSVISATTWAVLVVVTGGLALSFTRVRNIEQDGAQQIGYLALYILIASIGARADLKSILDTPLFLMAGVLWIVIHVIVLAICARVFRAPLFFVATGSMANVGGAASAPVVASAFSPSLAPVGVLMGVSGYILGIYAALFCAWMLGQLSTILL